MMALISFCFNQESASSRDSDFTITQHESRGQIGQTIDIFILQLRTPPGGEASFCDYCFVESRNDKADWTETQDRFSRKCARTTNPSGETYAILHIGYLVQIFLSTKGTFKPLSERLHIVDDVDTITAQLAEMQRRPPSFE
jgi:hypothetical protein